MHMPLPSPRMCGVMLAAIALLALMPRDATAGPLTGNQLPSITMALEDDVRLTWDFRPTIDMFSPAPGGGFQLTSSPTFDVFGGGAQVTIAGLAFDPDPFVLNNILITNTTNNTQSFSAFVGLPTTFVSSCLGSLVMRRA